MIEIGIIIGFCVLAYLFGSIPFGKIIGKSKIGNLKSIDPQTVGSGNIGATNVFRTAGLLKGIITVILDVGKATIPVFLTKNILQLDLQSGWQPNIILLVVIMSALLGSRFPVWLEFKGGKGVGVLMGSLLVILGWKWLILVACWIGIIIIAERKVSVGSLILVAILIPLVGYLLPIPLLYYLWIPASILIFWSHRENIDRLRKGEEKPLDISSIKFLSIFAKNKNLRF